jgi:hypothetical protein
LESCSSVVLADEESAWELLRRSCYCKLVAEAGDSSRTQWKGERPPLEASAGKQVETQQAVVNCTMRKLARALCSCMCKSP